MDEGEALRRQWYARAKEMSLESLPAFLEELKNAPSGYNTAAYAVAAAGIAASWAMNQEKGLTGFQAGFVMWEYMEHWNCIKPPSRLVQYKDMLYPQYKGDFDKTFSEDTWEWLQKEAQKGLDKWASGEDRFISPRVINHWLRITSGEKPFGYVTDKEYKNLRAPPALKTQGDVLKAWKEGKLEYKRR